MILDVLRAMARRWYIVLIGLLLTFGLAWAAYQATPPEYKARGLVLLLPGANAVAEGGNPFLALSGLEQPASIVVAYFASTAAQTEVAEVSGTADFSVQLDASTRGPVIAVEVTDTSEQGTIDTLDYLTERVPQELERLQSEVGAPASSVITSMPLVIDAEPEADNSGTIRITIAALAVGIVATGAATFALDGVLMRRRSRRKARADERFGSIAAPSPEDDPLDAPQDAEHDLGLDPPLNADLDIHDIIGDETGVDGETDADADTSITEGGEDKGHRSARPGASRSARIRASNPDSEPPAPADKHLGARAGRHR
ncbi:hypothetical protein ACFC1I_05450 [Microbacterium sp. NPDC056044]|uniref:hypothetical protein n=1 Tax=Microbacterium sp. NPDC056044 TaxID=3345690 RepID=UPI0035DA9B6C